MQTNVIDVSVNQITELSFPFFKNIAETTIQSPRASTGKNIEIWKNHKEENKNLNKLEQFNKHLGRL